MELAFGSSLLGTRNEFHNQILTTFANSRVELIKNLGRRQKNDEWTHVIDRQWGNKSRTGRQVSGDCQVGSDMREGCGTWPWSSRMNSCHGR